MKLFSERYGYTHPSDVIIRKELPLDVQNAICSTFDILQVNFNNSQNFYYSDFDRYKDLEYNLWVYFLNNRVAEFKNGWTYHDVAIPFLTSTNQWFQKLDLVEFSIQFLRKLDSQYDSTNYFISNSFINRLNSEFKRLNFAYRIVDDRIVEITSDEEIKSIDTALVESDTKVKEHLSRALEHYAKRPEGDYRNSIKESISAVEAYCRERTGKNTLGDAIKALKNTGITLHPLLETSLTKLYAYTNQPDTGIRHSLMDDSEGYTPGADEALFMLVTCSAFINYLRKKKTV